MAFMFSEQRIEDLSTKWVSVVSRSMEEMITHMSQNWMLTARKLERSFGDP